MRWTLLLGLGLLCGCELLLAGCARPALAPLIDRAGEGEGEDEAARDGRDDDRGDDEGKLSPARPGLAVEVAGPVETADEPPPPTCGADAPACDPACLVRTTRAALWATVYDVGNTFGVGEHQGLALLVHDYLTDPRFGPTDEVPWRHEGALWSLGAPVDAATQFQLRTLNPGGETTDDEPVSLESPLDDPSAGQRLCALETRLDERIFNHGRTVAERVPGDGYYANRDLIPLRLVASVVTQDDGELLACLEVIEDGYCDAVCGNCSYTADLANNNDDFDVDAPGGQLPDDGRPFGSSPEPAPCEEDPDTAVVESERICGRTPFVLDETAPDGSTRAVHYVGGSVWGPGDDPEEDGVAWESEADGGWPDPFTHCYDPASGFAQQTPLGVFPFRMITGKWGHNSNSDAEAQLRHFLGCAEDPVRAREAAWYNADLDGRPCTACGVPGEALGEPRQQPCIEGTNTASLGWGYASWVDTRGLGTSTSTVGAHNIGDLEVGRAGADTWSDLPKPQCRATGQPVFGM